MLPLRSEPFPFQAVRDLIGILRAMYGAARRREAGSRELARLRSLGKELSLALELAVEHPVGTMGHAAAWERAERATAKLGELVDCTTPLSPTLEAAARRVVGGADNDAREAARRARVRRG